MRSTTTRFKRCGRKFGMRCMALHDSNAAQCRRTTRLYPLHFHFLRRNVRGDRMAAACMVTRQGGESGVTAGLSAGADSGWDAEASERVAPIEKQRRFIIGFRIVEFTPK